MWASLGAALPAQPAGKPLLVSVDTLDSPAGPGSMGSSLTSSPEGTTWLSWIEPAGDHEHALKCAQFDAASGRWSRGRLVARGAGWFVNWADFPVLAAQKNRLVAAWFVGGHGGHDEGYRAEFSISNDGGHTWSPPQPITRESNTVEFVAFQPLDDGRLLAAWLDGRARAAGKAGQTLYARVLDGGPDADVLVDDFVCDCCQLSFAPVAGGGAILAYRGRTRDEIRDMRFARFRADRWDAPQTLHADGWKISGCPVNGPQLATDGQRIGAAWFTGAGNQPRVLVARAENAAVAFNNPVEADLGRPLGRIDTVMLRDGTLLVTWLEQSGREKEGGIYLRVLSRLGELSTPVLLAPTTTARASGFPRISLVSDRAPAQLLLSYTREGPPASVSTALITVQIRE